MKIITALSIFALNLFDTAFTFSLVLKYGYSVEANPLMRFAMSQMGDWFILLKILIGIEAVLLIVLFWNLRLLRFLSVFILTCYVGVTIYHLAIIFLEI